MPVVHVDEPQKITFFSIVKNASIAVSHWFRELVGEYTKVNGHSTGIDVDIQTGIFYLTEVKKDGYYTFTVVRNPWARMYDAYKDYTNADDEVKDKIMSINEWSSWPTFTDFIRNLDNFEVRGLENWNHEQSAATVQQTQYIDDSIDLIIRYENIEQELKTIEDMFGLDFRIQIDHNQDKEYRNHYTEETKNIIAHFFKDDIEKWDYTF